MNPGEYFIEQEDIIANENRQTVEVVVENRADRPVQVGSHFHFFEVNRCLNFDRAASYGMRLNIAAGTAMRFEPGQTHKVQLCALGGDRIVHGFNNLVDGQLDDEAVRARAMENLAKYCAHDSK